jgi:hypothetical protein
MTHGILGIVPQIKKAKIETNKLMVYLQDGRVVITPKKYFSFLRGNPGKIFIADGNTIIFDNADEVIHIEEILGRYEDYKYSFVNAKK